MSKFISSSERKAFKNCQEKKHKKLSDKRTIPTFKLFPYKTSKLNQKSMVKYLTTKIDVLFYYNRVEIDGIRLTN